MIGIIVLSIYIVLLALLVWGIKRVPNTKFTSQASNPFSIIIPFKDEADNLPLLLQSIQKLNYPTDLYEVIMIDDNSVDNSVQIIRQFNHLPIRIFNNKPDTVSPKKDALEIGIFQAQNEWIITTDADCALPADWLIAYNSLIGQKPHLKMIMAPVMFFDGYNLLDQFQQIEFLSLQGMTMGSMGWKKPFLSNGANLAFQKSAFYQVNGYAGNKHLATGDDVFLLEKFQIDYPNDIAFLKNTSATVKTQAQKNINSLIQQKIRWGSKTKNYKSALPKIIGIIVLLTNLLMLYCFTKFFTSEICILLIIIKILADAVYLWIINRFYQAKINPWFFVVTFVIYPIYYVLLVIYSFKSSYIWKGRKL